MKILFVTLSALEVNTSVTKSNIGLLRGFKELGHDVTILMPEVNKEAYYYDASYDLTSFNIVRLTAGGLTQSLANSNARATGSLKKWLFKTLRSIYKYFTIYERSVKDYVRQIDGLGITDKHFDVVISTSDPKVSHYFVLKMIEKGLSYNRWIQHWGDPFSSDISRRSFYPRCFFQYIESSLYRKANKIVFVSPFTAAEQRESHKKYANKIGFAPLVADVPTEETKDYTYKKNGILNVAYMGDYNSIIRNIMPLYNACSELPFVKLTIAGHSDLILKTLDNISVNKRLPSSEAAIIESNADVIVSIANLKGTQIPGKIYYLASSKKIIMITMERDHKEEMLKYLNSYNRFIMCDNTKDSIQSLLKSIYEKDRPSFDTPRNLMASEVVSYLLA